jgi:hypothetical protein
VGSRAKEAVCQTRHHTGTEGGLVEYALLVVGGDRFREAGVAALLEMRAEDISLERRRVHAMQIGGIRQDLRDNGTARLWFLRQLDLDHGRLP